MALSRVWASSSYSTPDGGNCVQARRANRNTVQVRDGKNPRSAMLTFTHTEWLAFTTAIKTGHHALLDPHNGS